MDELEFKQAMSECERKVEDALIVMNSVRTTDHILIHSDAIPVIEAFEEMMNGIRSAHKDGETRLGAYGIKVYPKTR